MVDHDEIRRQFDKARRSLRLLGFSIDEFNTALADFEKSAWERGYDMAKMGQDRRTG